MTVRKHSCEREVWILKHCICARQHGSFLAPADDEPASGVLWSLVEVGKEQVERGQSNRGQNKIECILAVVKKKVTQWHSCPSSKPELITAESGVK